MRLNRLLFEAEEINLTSRNPQDGRGEGEESAIVRLGQDDARAQHVRKVGWGGRLLPLGFDILTRTGKHLPTVLINRLTSGLVGLTQVLRAKTGDEVRVGVLNGGR